MKSYLAILFLFFWSQLTYAQQQATLIDKPSLYLASGGVLIDQTQKTAAQNNGKTNDVYLAGGFISIGPVDRKFGTIIRFSKTKRTTDSLSLNYYRTHRLYYKTYYEGRRAGKKGLDFDQTDSSKKIFSQDQKRILAYLKVNDTFNIDFTDYKTDTLVKRYSFKRIRIIPTITFYRLDGNKITSPIQVSENRQLSVATSDEVALISKNNNDLQRQYISYTIINLETGEKKHYSSNRNSIKLPNLIANTDYEIRCSYDIQPDSISIYRIHVKAKWYQLPIVYGFAIGLLLLTIAFFIILRLRRQISSSQKKQTEIEQSILRLQSQLNPHFTFNALSSIQGLMNTNRVTEANDYLQDFSSLLRKTLAKGQQIFNTLDQELEMMQTYIRLEALRYNFSWTIEMAPEINPSTIEIPTLLLQPLIENAIKHGIASLGTEGRLLITCRTGEEDSLLISIKDNGKWVNGETGAGFGLQLTNERISAINKLTKEKKIVLKFDKQNGTEANLLFYNWINN